mgnify:CR=1 FL=1
MLTRIPTDEGEIIVCGDVGTAVVSKCVRCGSSFLRGIPQSTCDRCSMAGPSIVYTSKGTFIDGKCSVCKKTEKRCKCKEDEDDCKIIIKRLLNNEVIIERKRRKAKFMYSKRYPTRMYSFVRDNLSNMRNKELIQAIQKEFGINIKYSQLADYMNYYGLSRKNVN